MADRTPCPRLDVVLPPGEPEKARIFLDASTVDLVKKMARFARVELSEFVEQAVVAWVQHHHPELEIVRAGESKLAGDLDAASRAGGVLASSTHDIAADEPLRARKKPGRRRG